MLDLPDTSTTLLVQALRLGVVVLLYGLVLRLLWTLRRELRAEPAAASTAADEAESDSREDDTDVAPVLVVVDVTPGGPGDGALDLLGRRFPLGATNLIGRDPTSSIVLPEAHVSRHHARIDFRQGEWWLDDLKSTNGTYLDEHRLDAPTSVLLDDVIRVGGVALAVREEPV